MSFTYSMPSNFKQRLRQYLLQQRANAELMRALDQCEFEYENLGNAYYAGMKNTPWDSCALDITFVGPSKCVSTMERHRGALESAISKALRTSESGFLLHNLFLLEEDISFLSYHTNEERLNADLEAARNVLADIIKVGERLSIDSLYTADTPEDNINDCLRNSLFYLGYTEVKDQTRHGLSESEKTSGEVDLLLTKDGREVALIECLKLSSVDVGVIDRHITKATLNYNPLGTPVFVVSYVSSKNFSSFWSRYIKHLEEFDYQIQVKRPLSIEPDPNAAIRLASVLLSRDGYDFPAFFVAIKLCEPIKRIAK